MVPIKAVLSLLTYLVALAGYIPLAPYLERIPQLLVPAALIFAVAADRRGFYLRGRTPTILSLLLFGYYLLQVSRANLVDPAVNLLAVLLAVRLVSEKSPRNSLQLFALALFTLAGSSLFSLSLAFLGYLFLLLALIAVALVILTCLEVDPELSVPAGPLRRLLTVSLLMPAGTVPLMVVFFFILPRTQFPLWTFLSRAGGEKTGISDSVLPGAASSVTESPAVAFRAVSGQLPGNRLYWRTIVLNGLAGQAWVRQPPPAGELPGVARGERVSVTIYREPGGGSFLPTLNIPRQLSGTRAATSGDLVFTSTAVATGRLKYEVSASAGDTIPVKGEIDRGFYTRLPEALPPRLAAAGQRLASQGESDRERLALAKGFFLDQRLAYASSGLPTGPQALDTFLFDTRRGHCEFFASAFALLLRSAGMPARLVGGYYGGEYNDLGGYYVVTEARAHVWVEAYLRDSGWVTVDPSTLTANFASLREAQAKGFARRLSLLLDTIGYYWNATVINYDLEKQVTVLNRTGERLRHLTLPARLPALLATAGAGALLCWLALRLSRRPRLSAEEKLLREFRLLVKRRFGLELPPAAGLYETAARLHDPLAQEFTARFGRALYRDHPLSTAETRELRLLLRRLRRRKNRLQ